MFDKFKSAGYALRERPSVLREEGLKLAQATKTIRQGFRSAAVCCLLRGEPGPLQYASWPTFILKSSRHTKVFLPSKIRGPSRPWRNSRIQQSPTPIRSCHSTSSRQISLLCSDALLSMPRSARLAPFFSSLKKWRARKEKHEAKQTKQGKSRTWRRAATSPAPIME